MNRRRHDRALRWAFALLSVVVAWQLSVPEVFSDLAENAGATPGSIVHRMVVDVAVPVAILFTAVIATKVYDKVAWPWLGGEYLGGWWIYALVASGEAPARKVVGFFYLDHSPEGAVIEEARAFYAEPGTGLVRRGEWISDTAWTSDRRIRFIFEMRSVNTDYVDPPRLYEGYLELTRTRDRAVAGISAWRGHFHDLGDRKMYLGDVYGERLGRRGWRRDGDWMFSLLQKSRDDLHDRLAYAQTTKDNLQEGSAS